MLASAVPARDGTSISGWSRDKKDRKLVYTLGTLVMRWQKTPCTPGYNSQKQAGLDT